MRLKLTYRPQQNLWLKKMISGSLALGILLNNILTPISSFAEVLSEDGRYETFEGNNITIDNILEEDKVDVEIEGDTLINLAVNNISGKASERKSVSLKYKTNKELCIIVNCISNTLQSNTQYGLIAKFIFEDGTFEHARFRDNGKLTGVLYAQTWNHENKNIESIVIEKHMDVISGDAEYNDVMILEGLWVNKMLPNYFEGLKSVGELENNTLELISKNKNLWDGTYEEGSIYTGENGFYPGEDSDLGVNRKRSYYIPVKPNTTYTISQKDFLNVEESEIYIHQYDKYKQNILWKEGLSHRGVKENLTFTTSSNVYYLRFRTQNNRELTPDTIMLEEGSVATSIIEQYNNKKVIRLSEPLRGLSNGATDKIIKKNGKWFIERNCAEITLDGSNDEQWSRRSNSFPSDTTQLFCIDIDGANAIKNNPKTVQCDRFAPRGGTGELQRDWECVFLSTNSDGVGIYLRIDNSKLDTLTSDGLKKWLVNNPTTVVYQLATPIYEPLEIDPTLNIYTDITHISNNSAIPTNMRVTVDRVLNRAVEYTELAKVNPTVKNLSNARYWNNLLKESIKKDQLQSEIDSMTNINDLQLERKSVTANTDVYIKSENMLMMTLNTNSITFDGFSGVEDMIKENAVNITINSSLPYQLNAYLPTEIQNSDKSNIMDKDILNIKENSESVYQTFANTTDKIVLKDNNLAGNDRVHGIDIKLKGGIAHQKDVYKTTIKFEAEQK